MASISKRHAACLSLLVFVAACSDGPTGTSAINPFPVTFTGVTTDSESGAAIEGVSVCWALHCTVSGADGVYSFTVADQAGVHGWDLTPSASRDGFETRQAVAPLAPSNVIQWSPSLQRRVTIHAGEIYEGVVSFADGYGLPYQDRCESCRAVHVSVPEAGTLTFRVTSDTPGVGLQSGTTDGAKEIASASDVVLKIGLPGNGAQARFTLTTTFAKRYPDFKANWPPLGKSGRIYVGPDGQPSSYHGSSLASRYILYDDSSFALQCSSVNFPFFEYRGTYQEIDGRIAFTWGGQGSGPIWASTAIVTPDVLDVHYNLAMQFSDFVDAVYSRQWDAR